MNMTAPAIYLWTAILAFLPISELRGAIPLAMANGLPWYAAYPFAAAVNALVAPCCWVFLSTAHRLFLELAEERAGEGAFRRVCRPLFRAYRRFFDRFVDRAREKLRAGVARWGWLGVALFVGIPLPITGAWTGTLGAWMLGLPKRRTLGAVILGVLISGAIVTAVVSLGLKTLGVFIKRA